VNVGGDVFDSIYWEALLCWFTMVKQSLHFRIRFTYAIRVKSVDD